MTETNDPIKQSIADEAALHARAYALLQTANDDVSLKKKPSWADCLKAAAAEKSVSAPSKQPSATDNTNNSNLKK